MEENNLLQSGVLTLHLKKLLNGIFCVKTKRYFLQVVTLQAFEMGTN